MNLQSPLFASGDPSLEVSTRSLPVEQLRPPLGGTAWTQLDDAVREAVGALAGRAVWMVNSTAVGGGVAELLRSWLPYWRAAGIDQHWAVVSTFFQVSTAARRRVAERYLVDRHAARWGALLAAVTEAASASKHRFPR